MRDSSPRMHVSDHIRRMTDDANHTHRLEDVQGEGVVSDSFAESLDRFRSFEQTLSSLHAGRPRVPALRLHFPVGAYRSDEIVHLASRRTLHADACAPYPVEKNTRSASLDILTILEWLLPPTKILNCLSRSAFPTCWDG